MTAIITPSSKNERLDVCIPQAQAATWEDYLHHVESLSSQQERVFFHRGRIWIEDMGNEGINHARFNKLLTMLLYSWFARQPDVKFDLLGGCVLEKPQSQGCAPDQFG